MRLLDKQQIEQWILKNNRTNQYPTVKLNGNTPQSSPTETNFATWESERVSTLINNMRVNFKRNPKFKTAFIEKRAKDKEYATSATDTIVISGKKPKLQTIRKPTQGNICFIDWLNITFDIATVGEKYRRTTEDDDQYMKTCQSAVADISVILTRMLGQRYRVTSQRQTGSNFYKYSFIIGENYGQVCIGGQRDTVLIMLNGTGCSLAPTGFEKYIHQFLTEVAVKAKITRCDLAHDDLHGDYLCVKELDKLESAGAFHCGGANPTVQHLGNWKHDDPYNKGLTMTIGQRSSGKFARFYQKGKQLGDKEGEYSNWVRAEIEYKSADRLIPFDILLDPSAYFIGSYPVFSDLFGFERSERIQTIHKTSKVTVAHSFNWIQRQAGKYITFYRNYLNLDDETILNILQSANDDDVPTRLHLTDAFIEDMTNNTNTSQIAKELIAC